MSDFSSRSARMASNYKRRYIISTHALERFRERVDEELRHRSDKDLSNLLDETMALNNFGAPKSQALNAPFAAKLRDLKIEVVPPKSRQSFSGESSEGPVLEEPAVEARTHDEVAAAIAALQQAAAALRQAATAVDEAHRRLINATTVKGK